MGMEVVYQDNWEDGFILKDCVSEPSSKEYIKILNFENLLFQCRPRFGGTAILSVDLEQEKELLELLKAREEYRSRQEWLAIIRETPFEEWPKWVKDRAVKALLEMAQ